MNFLKNTDTYFPESLVKGKLIKRYKHFLADMEIFSPVLEIDPKYATKLTEAYRTGVQVIISGHRKS